MANSTAEAGDNLFERWQKVILFKDPNPIQKFRIRFSTYLALVPLVCALVLLSLVLIFAKLNLYHLEGAGVIIDPQVRAAYYDQVIEEVAPILGYFFLLLLLTAAVGWVVLNWATHPFRHAEAALRKLLADKKRVEIDMNWQTESLDFEQTVQAYIDVVAAKTKPEKTSEPTIRYTLNYKFLFKFIAVFLPLSIIASMILRIVIESVYGKIVSLALNLLHGRSIQSHYILAQQEVLEDTQNIMLALSLLAYLLIGRYLSHHISTMIFVFTRAMRESKFPIRLRPTDIYHSLADCLNQLHDRR